MTAADDRPWERLPTAVHLLVATGFVVAIGYGIVAPVLPVFARSFDVGVTAASAVVSAFAVFRLLFGPASGQLVHWLGELWVLRLGLLVVAASSLACAYAASYPQLLVFRALGGIGSTMFTVSASLLLIRVSPPTMRGRAAGAWATGFLLGNIAGPLVGGAVVTLNLRTPFELYAVLLCVAVLLSGGLTSTRITTPDRPDEECEGTASFAAALRDPRFRAAMASNFVNGWTVYGVRIALVPLYIVDVLGWSNGWAGAALTAFAAGTAATSLLGGWLADHYGRLPPVAIGSVLVAVTMVGLGTLTSPVAILLASLMSGAGTGLLGAGVNATLADVVAGQGAAGRAAGATAGFQMVGDTGAILGPVLAGLAVDLGGFTFAFAMSGVVVAASLAAWLTVPDTMPRLARGRATLTQ